KVPAMVVWPPVVEKGLRIYHTVSSLDLFPTMLEMAGVEPPPGLLLRGKSFLPLLRGDEVEDWDDDFYAEYSMINYSKSFMRSYMADGWKLVIDFLDSTRNELYHLAFDPEENINLIDYSSEEIDYMKGKLSVKILERMSLIQDPLWVEMEMAKD
ncbi:MAG: sulfatase/phosphatase domain-containing protein, partial [Bacteroidota bacterium]